MTNGVSFLFPLNLFHEFMKEIASLTKRLSVPQFLHPNIGFDDLSVGGYCCDLEKYSKPLFLWSFMKFWFEEASEL